MIARGFHLAALSLRSGFRSLLLFLSLLQVLLRFAVLRIRCWGKVTPAQRAEWLHGACAVISRKLSMQVSASGELPASGLIVSNHLSYLDILFFSSLMPCIFVSKAEVLSWPMFGILARCGGTIFVERGRGAVIESVSRQIAGALKAGIPVVLFPEGTSTDGTSVLSFYPSLFEAAVATGAPVYPSAIGYELTDGCERDLCYYGDISFGPHLFKALGFHGLHAKVVFAAQAMHYPDRKSAAKESREQVIAHRRVLASHSVEADCSLNPA